MNDTAKRTYRLGQNRTLVATADESCTVTIEYPRGRGVDIRIANDLDRRDPLDDTGDADGGPVLTEGS